jgi:hypothetical protein
MANASYNFDSYETITYNGTTIKEVKFNGTSMWAAPSSGYTVANASAWGVPGYNATTPYYFVYAAGGSGSNTPIAPGNPHSTAYYALLHKDTGKMYSTLIADASRPGVYYQSINTLYAHVWQGGIYYALGPEITEWGVPAITAAWAVPASDYVIGTK